MKKQMLRLAAGLFVAMELFGSFLYGIAGQIPNQGAVRAGVLYRSGQPEQMEREFWGGKLRQLPVIGPLEQWLDPPDRDWSDLVKAYNIRTVIDLREDLPQKEWSRIQDEFCRKNGIRLVHIPMADTNHPNAQQWGLFKSVVENPSNWPVLVHCEMGSSRTGVMCGGYRIAIQGWSPRRACAEADEYHFGSDKDNKKDYLSFWEDLARGIEPTSRPAEQPATGARP